MTENTTDPSLQDRRETVHEIIERASIAMLTTQTISGALHARPLAIVTRDSEPGALYFFTGHPSDKTSELAAFPLVNVSIAEPKGYLSLSGSATVTHDRALIDELWNLGAAAWFENGKDDPSVALIRVDLAAAEYWDTDRPAVVKAVEFVRGLVSDHEPDTGDHGSVKL